MQGSIILAVSEKTLLPVLLPALNAKLLPKRLPEAVFDVLKRLDIPLATIDQELRQMQGSILKVLGDLVARNLA